MDFVVVGFGIGALGVLLGVLVRGWLAARAERAAARATDPALAAYERANAAECRGAGRAFLAAGGAVALATVGGLLGGLDDGSGALLVAATATVAALGIIVWGYLHRLRHPMPARPRPRPASVTTGPALAIASDLAAPEPEMAHFAMAADNALVGSSDDDAPEAIAAEELILTEPGSVMNGSADDPSLGATAPKADEASLQNSPAAANGHPVEVAVAAEAARIVAFVAQGARADAGDDAVSDIADRDDG